ncbi:MAG: hypothetical protein D4R73_11560 [Deltaproteobacteria bacterium]|nr:MAG: hypothetical protein D4R73_11560 [Deltaproteobacteria bacterium]
MSFGLRVASFLNLKHGIRNWKAESGELKKLEVRIQKSGVKSKGRGFPALCFWVMMKRRGWRSRP